MTMLGRGKRSASDKKKPDATKSDKTGKSAGTKSDKAARAEKAAKAAELAEEAAKRAREAARLAQIAADEAAATEAEDADEPAKSPEKPRSTRKPSRVEPAPGIAAEDDSAPSEDDSTTPEPLEAESDEAETGEAADEVDDVEAEEIEADDDTADEEDEPAKPKRLKLKKSAKADESDDEDDDEPRSARLGLPTVIAVLAVLTIALGVGTTVLGLKVKEQRATQQAAKEATFASSHVAQKMSSYDYRTLDSDLKAASALTTGKLHTEYGKLAEQLKTVAVQRQAVSNTTVMKVGVVSASPEKVVTLVYANRSSATKDDKEQRLPESLRMKMTMVEKDGKWLASEVVLLS